MYANDSPVKETRHKRNPSAVLKSIVPTRSQKFHESPPSPTKASSPTKKLLESNAKPSQSPLGEIHHNRERPGPLLHTLSADSGMDKNALLHKRSKSEFSFKTFKNDRDKLLKSSSKVDLKDSPKKTKSTTNLAALLEKSRGNKNVKENTEVKNKENQPPRSAGAVPPPIWAEFSSHQTNHQASQVTKIPLNDTWSVDSDINLQQYSPSKARGFDQLQLKPIEEAKATNTKTLSKANKLDNGKSFKERIAAARESKSNPTSRPTTSDEKSAKSSEPAKGGSRVRAAVAAFSGKTKDELSASQAKATPAEIEKAFEDMLVSSIYHRNNNYSNSY
jgi:hypothetical protein